MAFKGANRDHWRDYGTVGNLNLNLSEFKRRALCAMPAIDAESHHAYRQPLPRRSRGMQRTTPIRENRDTIQRQIEMRFKSTGLSGKSCSTSLFCLLSLMTRAQAESYMEAIQPIPDAFLSALFKVSLIAGAVAKASLSNNSQRPIVLYGFCKGLPRGLLCPISALHCRRMLSTTP